jgi:hypothetical protein
MAIICRRLFSEDKDLVLQLIQTRLDKESNVALSNNKINLGWVNIVMKDDLTYEFTHRVFGLFVDEDLDTIIVVKIFPDFYFVSMLMSKVYEHRKIVLDKGYNPNSAAILYFAIREMEKEGYNYFYSLIPTHRKWRRAEKNPNREIKDEYVIEEVEIIPAGQLPKIDLHKEFLTRPFNIDMVVRKLMRKI